jgi:hypothetical protein
MSLEYRRRERVCRGQISNFPEQVRGFRFHVPNILPSDRFYFGRRRFSHVFAPGFRGQRGDLPAAEFTFAPESVFAADMLLSSSAYLNLK